ncbi:MAG: hypothetical protein QXV69_04825 [Sulfolobaceae archaeon]
MEVWDEIPGLIAVYKVVNDKLVKIYGQNVRIDLTRLYEFLKKDYSIGEAQAEKIKFLKPFLGFAMVLDDLGIVYLRDLVIFVDPLKTDWDKVIKIAMKEVVVR